ncbi:hypothetical protein DFH08DRAFT_850388 [Mycena albidolilacea]|uniref:Uncharacterized protein n=1 Tax=Mycena albidolilacea TaxID=1033008 RepID=A0AAD7EX37_9AGAR|nr:hypothetical protein DFH08DRAFT_850388 [Mycena albidolilacea]
MPVVVHDIHHRDAELRVIEVVDAVVVIFLLGFLDEIVVAERPAAPAVLAQAAERARDAAGVEYPIDVRGSDVLALPSTALALFLRCGFSPVGVRRPEPQVPVRPRLNLSVLLLVRVENPLLVAENFSQRDRLCFGFRAINDLLLVFIPVFRDAERPVIFFTHIGGREGSWYVKNFPSTTFSHSSTALEHSIFGIASVVVGWTMYKPRSDATRSLISTTDYPWLDTHNETGILGGVTA